MRRLFRRMGFVRDGRAATRRRRASALGLAAMLIALVPAVALATHGKQPEVFPAYYEGEIRHVMMGPGGNSNNPNQAPSPCWGLGPDFSKTKRAADVPLFYTLFVPGASQMMCPDGTRVHDMVLTAVPGDAGYNGAVRLVRCVRGPNFDIADMPYTSAQQVEAAIAAGELNCTNTGRILAAPVVRG